MNNNALLNFMVNKQAEMWLKENPLLLNKQEKQKFLNGLKNFIENKSIAIDDEVYDFLVQRKLISKEPRENTFMSYLTHKYGTLKNKKILDVGAGRTCPLSKSLVNQGGIVTAMDTNIRLTDDTLKKAGIIPIRKLFRCDEYANDRGTKIENFDLIVGLEPCDATEHIIRQSLKHNKPFDINLCAAPHNSLDGKTFKTHTDWYHHLENISQEVSIVENDCGFIATNNKYMEF